MKLIFIFFISIVILYANKDTNQSKTISSGISVEKFLNKEIKEIIKHTKKSIIIEPNNILLYLSLAESYNYMNMYSKSIKNYKEAIKYNYPNSTYSDEKIYYYIASAYSKMKQNTKAMEYYNKSLSKISLTSNSNIYVDIAILHEYMKDYDKAIEFYNKAAKYHNSDSFFTKSRLYGIIAKLYIKDKEDEKAIKFYIKSLSKTNEVHNSKVYHYMGNIYYHNKKYEEAIDTYQKILKINKYEKIHFIYAYLAYAYRNNYQYNKAIQYYNKYLEYDPNDINVQLNLIELELISNNKINEKRKQIFLSTVNNNKHELFLYELLNNLYQIYINKDISISEFLLKNENEKLDNWSFDLLKKWANKKDKTTKNKLLDAIEEIEQFMKKDKNNK